MALSKISDFEVLHIHAISKGLFKTGVVSFQGHQRVEHLSESGLYILSTHNNPSGLFQGYI